MKKDPTCLRESGPPTKSPKTITGKAGRPPGTKVESWRYIRNVSNDVFPIQSRLFPNGNAIPCETMVQQMVVFKIVLVVYSL